MFESSVKEKDHQTNGFDDVVNLLFESSVKEKDHQTLVGFLTALAGLRAV